jgi:hypothetical protein
MTKKNYIAYLVISSTLTLLSGLAFLNNISVIVKWWNTFITTGGDAQALAENFSGCIPWLDWTAVDYSAATTLIPFLGFLLITIGIIRIMRHKEISAIDYFPFFKGYDQLNVAFGLIGTLWGIIIIGYYDMESVAITDLMMCLHTALFSTLTAVVWVFVIDHPILRPLLRKLLVEEELNAAEDADLIDLLERLRGGAAGLHEAWTLEKNNLESFSTAVEEAKQKLVAMGVAGEEACKTFESRMLLAVDGFTKHVEEIASDMESRQQRFEEAFTNRLSAVEKSYADMLVLVGDVTQLVDGVQVAQKAISTELERVVADNDTLRGKLTVEVEAGNAVRITAAELGGKVNALSSTIEELKAEAAHVAEANEKAQAQFRKQYEELTVEKLAREADLKLTQKQLEESKAQTLKAEKLLSKIKAAFNAE